MTLPNGCMLTFLLSEGGVFQHAEFAVFSVSYMGKESTGRRRGGVAAAGDRDETVPAGTAAGTNLPTGREGGRCEAPGAIPGSSVGREQPFALGS